MEYHFGVGGGGGGGEKEREEFTILHTLLYVGTCTTHSRVLFTKQILLYFLRTLTTLDSFATPPVCSTTKAGFTCALWSERNTLK